MNFDISDDARAAAKRCGKQLVCLNGNKEELCRLKCDIKGEVLFIECREEAHCFYQITFGYGTICTCPVRREIFAKYGI